MKLGVLTVLLGSMTLDDTLAYLKGLGVQQVEIGCGGNPGTAHADAVDFMAHPEKIARFEETVARYGLPVAALSTHNNPLHPNREIAAKSDEELHAAVLLAQRLGVKTVVTFSGCPGDCEESKYPNWSIAPWPEDFEKIREWQWNEKLIPYWKGMAEFAQAHGVRIAFELHPGFCVYNPATMLRLREAVGPAIGANVDPSHLFWQGIDPVAAIRALKGCIYHFHAKDTAIDPYNCAVNGVLDTANLAGLSSRSWIFRTVGYGHGEETWRAILSELKQAGYDGVVSIEHEDGLMTPKEGLEKAIAFLRKEMIFQGEKVEMYWA